MSPFDDIPQAARDVPLYSAEAEPSWLRRTRMLRRFVGLALLALAAGGLVAWYQTGGFSAAEFARPFEGMISGTEVSPGVAASGGEAPLNPSRDVATRLAPSSRTLLNHRAFSEAPVDDLVPLSNNVSIRLRTAAAAQYEAMTQAAARQGIRLVPLSGFRSQAEQEQIFFNLKAQRGQDAQTRAEVSAPPGYSEHHTGYAIDIGDGNQLGTHLDTTFVDTRAYQWLETNAVRYGYEISFPPDNFQGVAFEPWHWRFVGDRTSLEIFYSN
ncbi:D-alanyl-D-alanine carboxypeptidase family protein [Leptolyngbya sp. KIOST-1]|uniref:M15 family metallopeptidase n=1 Tax=Leptolyngbya sp. KIOST-1 TaxID=1229172 RepID=UPI000689C5D3|nr:M15 family metallopeptidase [Leptolyngbya sp. KIOST-1]